MNTVIKNTSKYLVIDTEKTMSDGTVSNIKNHLYVGEVKPEVKGSRLCPENQVLGNMLLTELLIRSM
jgi:hypothetical protein